MKNGRYFNFRDICDRNLWDTGYLVKKLQGYGILRPPLMGPHFCYPENLSLIFKIISVRPASLLSRKYILVEGKEFFCSLKVPKFLHPASFANATSKTDLLFFLTNKRLSAGTIYVRFLIYLKAIHEQK